MTPIAALGEGMRRVNRAPAVLAGVWIVSIVMTLPMALALRAMIAQHLGSSLAADTALLSKLAPKDFEPDLDAIAGAISQLEP